MAILDRLLWPVAIRYVEQWIEELEMRSKLPPGSVYVSKYVPRRFDYWLEHWLWRRIVHLADNEIDRRRSANGLV